MAGRRTGAARRWALVGGLLAVLLALPTLLGALPASDADVPAAELRRAALDSADVPFAGYAQSAGGLAARAPGSPSPCSTRCRCWSRCCWRSPTWRRGRGRGRCSSPPC